ncbi:MAG: hypothetical protein ACREL1_05425, partial [bacterium]
MRKEFYISCLAAALAVITPGFVFLTTGCKKTNQPLGYDAPNGLDVPSPTPLPLSGAIVVNVSDTNSVVTNLT